MTIRYVGIGGNDGNNGLTWALRKETLNGAEDTPVVAGDTIYVGPGAYREMLTVDVSGGGVATPITYIGDVSGEHTDGVGGIVRITGSDDDQSSARNTAISADSRNYRTFRGFAIDMGNIYANNCTDWIIEDCSFSDSRTGGGHVIEVWGVSQKNFTIRRCAFTNNDYGDNCVQFSHSADVDNAGHLFENCIVVGNQSYGVRTSNVGGIEINNCGFFGCIQCVRVAASPTVGQTVDIYNCILQGTNQALFAIALGEIIEDYNTFYGNNTNRTNTGIGANSVTYPSLVLHPIFLDGIKYPWWYGELGEWSQVSRRWDAYDNASMGIYIGISVATDDLFGIYRPTGVSLLSWGAIQLREGERETTTVRTGTASIILESAGDHQLFVPVTNVSTTIEVYVYREANYEGLAPQMIIRQPGQEDEVATDTGASGAWNQLTKTLTPAADPPYVCVILRSHNEALAGNFDVFFDDLDVS